MARRYFFKTSAVGAGARIDRVDSKKCDQPIPAIAVSALPASGGRSESKKEHFRFDLLKPRKDGVLAVRSAESSAQGCVDMKTGATSESNASVRGFSVLGKVTAEVIEAHLKTALGIADQLPTIQPVGNKLEGFEVDGFPVKVTLDEKLFCDCGTKEALAARYAKDKDLQGKFSWRFNTEKGAAAIPEVRGCFVCSLVKELKWADKPHPDITIDGYRLIWPGFGIIYVGEIQVGLKSRQLTMLRVELGEQGDSVPAPGGNKIQARSLSVSSTNGSASGGNVGDGVGTMP